MTKIKHPNLVNLIAFSASETLSLVCEFMEFGNLYDYIHKSQYEWDMIYRVSWDIASGLSYLHSVNPPLVHRDLKSPNGIVKLRLFNSYSCSIAILPHSNGGRACREDCRFWAYERISDTVIRSSNLTLQRCFQSYLALS